MEKLEFRVHFVCVIRKIITIDLATGVSSARRTHTSRKSSEEVLLLKRKLVGIGGDDGARTRDLRRDRPAF